VAGRPPLTEVSIASARRRLGRRADVRAAVAAAWDTGDTILVTGGAVRDAFLAARGGVRAGRGRRDLDIAVPSGRAAPFGAALAVRLGSRPVAIGTPPRQILHFPLPDGSVDLWESEAEVRRDLARRDFTVNALAFEIPSWRFLSPAGALRDLSARRLAPTRPGVLLEDPLRVLRAARLLAELPGFRLVPAALPELRRAARRLGDVAAERRLAELDRLLSAAPGDAARSLGLLEGCGALSVLLRGVAPPERREGIRRVARMKKPSPTVARVLLLSPLGAGKAQQILRKWKTTRREQRVAARLLALEESLKGRARRARSWRREVVETLRSVSPFFEEFVLFLSALPGTHPARLAESLAPLLSDSRRRTRLLRPRRPLDAVAALRGLGVPEGPRFGALLSELDIALASGEIRGPAASRRFLADRAAEVPR
jgi:tRNA nucleotidyltransferase/poly(A) polymerase